jgi:nitrogen regulatory protein P-II 2
MLAKAVDAIKTASSSGKIGDGKIFTFDLQEAVRIRTNETGDSAL